MFYPKEDQSGAGDTDGKPRYVQQTKSDVFPEAAKSAFKVISEHDVGFKDGVKKWNKTAHDLSKQNKGAKYPGLLLSIWKIII
ncbi:MAG: hypothetical protein QM731_13380 [Chitinophagaceae bacterium]